MLEEKFTKLKITSAIELDGGKVRLTADMNIFGQNIKGMIYTLQRKPDGFYLESIQAIVMGQVHVSNLQNKKPVDKESQKVIEEHLAKNKKGDKDGRKDTK